MSSAKRTMVARQSFLAVDRIRAVLLAAAVFAFEVGPDGIELVHCGFDQSGFICQDACLEVAVAWTFHSQTCAGEICRADVGKFEVKDDQFEVYSGGTEPAPVRKTALDSGRNPP